MSAGAAGFFLGTLALEMDICRPWLPTTKPRHQSVWDQLIRTFFFRVRYSYYSDEDRVVAISLFGASGSGHLLQLQVERWTQGLFSQLKALCSVSKLEFRRVYACHSCWFSGKKERSVKVFLFSQVNIAAMTRTGRLKPCVHGQVQSS